MTVEPKLYGCQSMTGDLRRVLVRRPLPEDLREWVTCSWRAEPDAAAIAREHEAFCELLDGAGIEVVLAESPARNADGGGPTQVIPAASTASAKSGFSARNPYPG